MASLTIRKLDDAVKTYLRLRSARNRRSVEEEVRVILRELIEGREEPLTPFAVPPEASPAPASSRTSAVPEASVTLIIGGGIAAFKSLDLIRRLKERRIEVRCVLTKAAEQFVTFQAAAANADWKSQPGYGVILANQPGDASWPMTAATWILVYKKPADAAATGEALKFFAWSYAKGQDMAKALDYVPMPSNVVADIEKMWGTDVKDSGGKPVYSMTH